MPQMTDLPHPYLLFLGDTTEKSYAKTAFGLADWAPDRCVGEWSCGGATVTTDLPYLTPKEARVRGAKALVIGVANLGGVISESWLPSLIEALESGLDIISGMHAKLASVPQLKHAAERNGRRLFDIRTPPPKIPIATGRKRSGKRLLTVGTDCALGKKYTALALVRAFEKRGLAVDFRATGQTGIMISGQGIPMDAVVADFAAGAAEMLSPDQDGEHWDVIEGQGSLFHPAYAGVSARQPTGRHRRLPSTRPHACDGASGLSAAQHRSDHRHESAPGKPHQRGHSLRRRQLGHFASGCASRPKIAGCGEPTSKSSRRRSNARCSGIRCAGRCLPDGH